MKFFTYLIAFFTLFRINFLLINVLLIKISDEKDPNIGNISLDLTKIDSKYFELTKYDYGPEAYKISPKGNNEIDMITMGIDVIWTKDVSSKFLGITIYESDVNEILFALRIVENGVCHSLHYLKNDELMYIGMVEFLDLINDEFLDREKNVLKKLDLSDDFHKLFFRYVLKEQNKESYESYRPYDEDDVFVKIVDREQTIFEWKTGCKHIEIYKKDGKYLLVLIELTDKTKIFLKYNQLEGKFTQTNEKSFDMVINHLGLKKFGYILDTRYDQSFRNLTDLKVRTLVQTSIDISLKNKNWQYTSINVLDDLFIVSKPVNSKVINTISDKGVVILQGFFENVSLTHLKTSNGQYYLELSWSEGELRRPNLYFEKSITEKIWIQISQKEFYNSFSRHIIESDPPSTIKYLDVNGLTSGYPIESLPEHTFEKINSLAVQVDSVNQNELRVQRVDKPSEDHDYSVNEVLLSTKDPDEKIRLKVSKNPSKEDVGNIKSNFLWSSMNLTFIILGFSFF